MKKLFPESIDNKNPNKFVLIFAWLLFGFNMFRSLEHIFSEDGGAESIAGIPLSTYSAEAANNIVSMFAQWGFSQLVLSLFFLLVLMRMRDLIPLMLLILALENILRLVVGLYKPLVLGDAPPGSLSWVIGLVTLAVFFLSIREKRVSK